MIAFLRSETVSTQVPEILLDGENRCIANSINLCEV